MEQRDTLDCTYEKLKIPKKYHLKLYPRTPLASHEEFFFMCTRVKNGYRGGDVFGCHSLGEEGSKGGRKILT